MKIDDFMRHMSKEDIAEASNISRKILFTYLLTKKRDEEENKILLSCILSYIFVFVMIIIFILLFVQLSRETIIDEEIIKSFVIKCLVLLVFTILFDLLVVGKKWYRYCSDVSDKIRKETNGRLR